MLLITRIIVLFIGLITSLSFAEPITKTDLPLKSEIFLNSQMPFEIHHGDGPYANVLAMNINYSPVEALRLKLDSLLDVKLKYFDGWKKEGEGHVTTVTPTEYFRVIKDYVNIDQIDQIARENNIQDSDINILGLGSAKKIIDGGTKETFFLIVESRNLRLIRQKIFEAFVQAGGDPAQWQPFYPHITIGYTGRDLHIDDGVIKDVSNSLDPRFNLVFEQ